MAIRTDEGAPETGRAECWCCGTVGDHDRMIHLGNHPEVALCPPCGHWAAKQAWEIEDRTRSGPVVRARDSFRSVRRAVVDRGWHRSPVFGGPLRWLGKRLP